MTDNINFSIQAATLIAAGFFVTANGKRLIPKDIEKLLQLAATSTLSDCCNFYENIVDSDESD